MQIPAEIRAFSTSDGNPSKAYLAVLLVQRQIDTYSGSLLEEIAYGWYKFPCRYVPGIQNVSFMDQNTESQHWHDHYHYPMMINSSHSDITDGSWIIQCDYVIVPGNQNILDSGNHPPGRLPDLETSRFSIPNIGDKR